MKLGLRTAAAAAALLATSVGCSSGNGLFGQDLPAGDITLADALTGASLNNTSPTAPYMVPDLRFAISIAETRFNGPYSISIIKEQNVATAANGGLTYPFSFNLPCFVAHQTDTSSHANVVTFQGDNANGLPSAFPIQPLTTAQISAGGNPCHSGELETAQIGDGKGHSVLFYYEEE